MKKIKLAIISTLFLAPCMLFSGCSTTSLWSNPGDTLGGGGTATEIPSTTTDSTATGIQSVTDTLTLSSSLTTSSVPEDAIQITSDNLTISASGNYYLTGTLDVGNGQIKITATNVVIYLNGVTINKITDKKIINSKEDVTLVLVDNSSNQIKTTYDDCTAIGSDKNLTIVGNGTMVVNSTDNCISATGTLSVLGGTITCVSTSGNGIKAESIIINNANITTTTVDKDGIHAEIDYDDNTTAPSFTYEKGYVYSKNSTLNITTTGSGDGIQADSFVQIVSGTYNITTNGGAPTNVTETSSNNADGKAIKAGNIDWGTSDTELNSTNYAIYIQSGTFVINSNDDAIHSNGNITILGGTFTINSGDDGIHADELLKIDGGTFSINKSYEGLEASKIEISNGTITLTSTDDGINAADGTSTQNANASNSNCYIIISGGNITVNAQGDGVDSNGTILMTGGTLYINGPTGSGNGSLDSNGGIIINGGYLVAVGSLGMVETPTTTSSQYIVSFAQNTSISAGTRISLTDSSGNTTFVELTTTKACQSIIISCPELTNGSTYKIYGGSTILATFTVSSKITTVGSSTTSTNPGGTPPSGGRR